MSGSGAWRWAWLACLAALTSAGCALLEPEALGPSADGGVEAVIPLPEDEEASAGEQAEPMRAAPAVVELQREAQAASAAGEHERAAALLERALRVDPQNPALWHNLAIVRFRQGEHAQAENLALRSVDRAQGRDDLQRRNWELIAEARAQRGDGAGAEDARRRADSLAAGAGP